MIHYTSSGLVKILGVDYTVLVNFSYVAGGNVYWHNHFKNVTISIKIEHMHTL